MESGLTRTLEEYLETIYVLKYVEGKKVIRVRDIARKLGVKMSSVTVAMKRLAELGFIEYEVREYIDLTEKGKKLGEELYNREEIIIEFLTKVLRVSEETARKDACKMEHELSQETVDRILLFIKFLEHDAHKRILDEFKKFLEKQADA